MFEFTANPQMQPAARNLGNFKVTSQKIHGKNDQKIKFNAWIVHWVLKGTTSLGSLRMWRLIKWVCL